MNIIETVRAIMTDYPGMSEFTNGCHIDFTSDEVENYGLTSTGDSLVSEDILGNQTRQHNFTLYAINQAVSDFERLQNSSFLLELSFWLERKAVNGQIVTLSVADETYQGELLQLKCDNGMAYAVSEDGQMTTYQLQIAALYKINMEV